MFYRPWSKSVFLVVDSLQVALQNFGSNFIIRLHLKLFLTNSISLLFCLYHFKPLLQIYFSTKNLFLFLFIISLSKPAEPRRPKQKNVIIMSSVPEQIAGEMSPPKKKKTTASSVIVTNTPDGPQNQFQCKVCGR